MRANGLRDNSYHNLRGASGARPAKYCSASFIEASHGQNFGHRRRPGEEDRQD